MSLLLNDISRVLHFDRYSTQAFALKGKPTKFEFDREYSTRSYPISLDECGADTESVIPHALVYAPPCSISRSNTWNYERSTALKAG
jgi:hypothetical protein